MVANLRGPVRQGNPNPETDNTDAETDNTLSGEGRGRLPAGPSRVCPCGELRPDSQVVDRLGPDLAEEGR